MKCAVRRADAILYAKACKSLLAPFCATVQVAGSLRRQAPVIGDLDFVLVLAPGVGPTDLPETQGGARRRRMQVGPLRVDLLLAQPACWGAALLSATGPWWLNISQRAHAKRRGLRLNEYGLWGLDPSTGLPLPGSIAGQTEQGVYDALGLPWLEPAERGAHVVEIARFPSATCPGQEHIVEAGPAGVRCSCRGFTYHGHCWHVASVAKEKAA